MALDPYQLSEALASVSCDRFSHHILTIDAVYLTDKGGGLFLNVELDWFLCYSDIKMVGPLILERCFFDLDLNESLPYGRMMRPR